MSNIIENTVFVITAFACALFVVITQSLEKITVIEEHVQSLENELITQSLEKITVIEEHVRSLENELKLKHEHIMKCILYKAVCICEPIHGITIKIIGGYVSFKNVSILDRNEKRAVFTINRDQKRNEYRISKHCTSKWEEDHTNILIQFQPIIFKYIEFDNFYVLNTKYVSIVLLSQNTETEIKIKQKEQNIICNASMFTMY